jgi:hypothetical protein
MTVAPSFSPESEHQCYMLPVDYDRQKKQTYIFFDFECTQDDMMQCQQGYQPDDNGNCIHCKSPRCGAFEHKPNLCVVHRVCLKCMDQGVDKESICQTCGKNELVFAGPNTTEHFCQWLFSGENEGATVIQFPLSSGWYPCWHCIMSSWVHSKSKKM